jgi:hypothetical protein
MNIPVVEDDLAMANVLAEGLREEAHNVDLPAKVDQKRSSPSHAAFSSDASGLHCRRVAR